MINDIARFFVTYLSLQGRLVMKEWSGTIYSAGSVEFDALLGSPNGAGIAHLLIEHNKGLCHKTVDMVTVFRKKWDAVLPFHIMDVDRADAEPFRKSDSYNFVALVGMVYDSRDR